MDYVRTGEFAAYQLIALAIIVYGLTFGKSDFKRLDAYLQRKITHLKGLGPTFAEASPGETAPREKAADQRRGLYWHLAAFVVGQAVLFAVGESWLAAQFASGMTAEPSALMNAGQIWAIVFVVDAIWSLSYTLFPRRTETLRIK